MHVAPNSSKESRDEALFHYTTADGLLGILKNNELWGTAHYCANDVSELAAAIGLLTPFFRAKTRELIQQDDYRMRIFTSRGVDPIEAYAEKFEKRLNRAALDFFCVYLTCFCKPRSEEDFQHGLLSQWRGYGADGGYALQFNRRRLEERINAVNSEKELNYELQDVNYSPDNPLKDSVTFHSDAFIDAYLEHLNTLARPLFNNEPVRSPIAGLTGGPLERLLDYLIHTKSSHFVEENECRMSVLESVSPDIGILAVDWLSRNGLVVPFVRTPRIFDVRECIDWIIVGPGPRIGNRFTSVSQTVRKMGLNIKVRPSHIPFTRD